MKTKLGYTVLVFVALAIPIGCGDDDSPDVFEEVTQEDCADVCDKFDECQQDIDVERCVEDCENLEDVDPAFETAMDECDDCLDDTSCVEGDACWASCPALPGI